MVVRLGDDLQPVGEFHPKDKFWQEGVAIEATPRLRALDQLELGEGILDGIEVGTVGRQMEQRSPACFDSFSDALNLVGGQIDGVDAPNGIIVPEWRCC